MRALVVPTNQMSNTSQFYILLHLMQCETEANKKKYNVTKGRILVLPFSDTV